MDKKVIRSCVVAFIIFLFGLTTIICAAIGDFYGMFIAWGCFGLIIAVCWGLIIGYEWYKKGSGTKTKHIIHEEENSHNNETSTTEVNV